MEKKMVFGSVSCVEKQQERAFGREGLVPVCILQETKAEAAEPGFRFPTLIFFFFVSCGKFS